MSDKKDNMLVRAAKWFTEDGNSWKALGFVSLALLGPLANVALSDEVAAFFFEDGSPKRAAWGLGCLIAFGLCLVLGGVSYIAGLRHERTARRIFAAERKVLQDNVASAISAKETAEECQRAREETIATLLEDVTTVVNGYLYGFAEAVLEFTDDDRASLYIHDGKRFVPIGRYSSHPRFRRKGRPFFSENEGCIGAAWSTGEAFLRTLPEFGDDYLQAHAELGMSSDVITELRMKPRFLYARRIDSVYKSPKEPLGVLVIESRKPSRFTIEAIRSHLQDQDSFVRGLIEVVRPHAPSVDLMGDFLDG